MILYRILLGFGLSFAIVCATLYVLGVADARSSTIWFVSGLMALLGLFIGGGMWLGSRGRYRLANLALGIVALAGGSAILFLGLILRAGGLD